MKQSAIQPARNFYSTTEPDLFSNPPSMMDNRDPIKKGNPIFVSAWTYLEVVESATSELQYFSSQCGVPLGCVEEC